MKRILCLLSGLLMAMTGFAQEEKENEFALGVQIRPRAEYRNGVLFPRAAGEESSGFINNRSRITMGYTRDRLSLGLGTQHVGVWG